MTFRTQVTGQTMIVIICSEEVTKVCRDNIRFPVQITMVEWFEKFMKHKSTLSVATEDIKNSFPAVFVNALQELKVISLVRLLLD